MPRAGGIEVRDLVVRYGEAAAVDGVSFTVERGEHVTLLGPVGLRQDDDPARDRRARNPVGGTIHIAGATMYSAIERRNVPVESAASRWCSNPMRCGRI